MDNARLALLILVVGTFMVAMAIRAILNALVARQQRHAVDKIIGDRRDERRAAEHKLHG
jgi:hypothetical protein